MSSKKKKKAQADKKARKESRMKGERPGGTSKYARKNRSKEIQRGYSTRPGSPFYLAPSQREAAA